jgi:hypothetical protein
MSSFVIRQLGGSGTQGNRRSTRRLGIASWSTQKLERLTDKTRFFKSPVESSENFLLAISLSQWSMSLVDVVKRGSAQNPKAAERCGSFLETAAAYQVVAFKLCISPGVIDGKLHTVNIKRPTTNFQVQNNVRTLIVRTGDLQSSTLETNPSPSISRPRDL